MLWKPVQQKFWIYCLLNAWSNVWTKIDQSETLIRGVDKFFKDLSRQKLPDFSIFGSGIQQDFPRSYPKPYPSKTPTLTKGWVWGKGIGHDEVTLGLPLLITTSEEEGSWKLHLIDERE